MYLRKYQDSDFSLLAQWVTSPDLLFQFAGTDFSFPLTQNQLTQEAKPSDYIQAVPLPSLYFLDGRWIFLGWTKNIFLAAKKFRIKTSYQLNSSIDHLHKLPILYKKVQEKKQFQNIRN